MPDATAVRGVESMCVSLLKALSFRGKPGGTEEQAAKGFD